MYQNLDIIERHGSSWVILLAGDHVYKMDYGPLLEQHVESGADVTVACVEVPRAEASAFGVMHVDGNDRSANSWKSRRRRQGCRTVPTWSAGEHGHLRV